MHQCCVFGCRNAGNHSFPKEKKARQLWEAATRCKDFRAKKHSKMCSAHFKFEDFIQIGKYSGLNNTRRILKKGIVPSVFPWTKTEDTKSEQRRENASPHDVKQKMCFSYSEKCDGLGLTRSVTTATCNTSSTTTALNLDVDCVEEIVIQENSVNNPENVQNDIATVRNCATQKNYQFYTIESFRYDDKGVDFYTGLESYSKFMFVFNTLCPEAHSITYERSPVLGLSVEDQFFLTLMKLRRNKEDYELGRFFDVSPCTVSNIFITWINFMHQMWSMLNIWPDRKSHLTGMNVVTDRKLSSKRIQIENNIGLSKTYYILNNPVNINYVPLMSKIYFVCVMMCNFRENIFKSKQ